MDQRRRQWIMLAWVVILVMSCTLVSQPDSNVREDENLIPTPAAIETAEAWEGGDYQNQEFSFSVPEGWSIHEGPSAKGKNAWNYFALNLTILVEAKGSQYLPKLTITRRDIPPGSSLEQVFDDTYAEIAEEINQTADIDTIDVDGLPALVNRYDRPWGEPWYSFQDTWVEKNEQIYMVSCQSRLNSSQEDLQGCDTILDNLHFK